MCQFKMNQDICAFLRWSEEVDNEREQYRPWVPQVDAGVSASNLEVEKGMEKSR